MKMFTAAEKNESLTEVFKAECASMRSQLTSPEPSIHSTPHRENQHSKSDQEVPMLDLNSDEEDKETFIDTTSVVQSKPNDWWLKASEYFDKLHD